MAAPRARAYVLRRRAGPTLRHPASAPAGRAATEGPCRAPRGDRRPAGAGQHPPAAVAGPAQRRGLLNRARRRAVLHVRKRHPALVAPLVLTPPTLEIAGAERREDTVPPRHGQR